VNKHAILNCDDFKGFLGIGDESHTDFRRVINVVPTLPNVPRIDKVCGSLMIQLNAALCNSGSVNYDSTLQDADFCCRCDASVGVRGGGGVFT
jgi:hypothetical protein